MSMTVMILLDYTFGGLGIDESKCGLIGSDILIDNGIILWEIKMKLIMFAILFKVDLVGVNLSWLI
jgi:hypothetical protein